MVFTLWFGPVPIRWLTRIEQVSATGFTDRQVRGPFRQWVHRHTYLPVDQNTTQVLDDVYLEVSRHPIWGPVGLLMRINLPILFTYRGWKTRRILEKKI